jgi:hypothetical protein
MTEYSLRDLIALLCFEEKRALKQHCRRVIVLQSDLASLILTAKSGQLPWQHLSHHRNFIPEHLSLTQKDLAALASNEVGRFKPAAQKAANKINAMFDDRRLLSGHMFFKLDLSNWHFFYFDQRDFAPRKNHWKEGPHIHFINRLWPIRTAQSVWEEFCSSPSPLIRGALHIRFKRDRTFTSRPFAPQHTRGTNAT